VKIIEEILKQKVILTTTLLVGVLRDQSCSENIRKLE